MSILPPLDEHFTPRSWTALDAKAAAEGIAMQKAFRPARRWYEAPKRQQKPPVKFNLAKTNSRLGARR